MRAPDWLSKCITDNKNRPLPVLANAFAAIENDSALRDCLAYDEMACTAMLLHQVGYPIGGDLVDQRPLTDTMSPKFRSGCNMPGWNASAASRCKMPSIATHASTAITRCATISRA